jgi:hypothetical protein
MTTRARIGDGYWSVMPMSALIASNTAGRSSGQ